MVHIEDGEERARRQGTILPGAWAPVVDSAAEIVLYSFS